jgi:T4 RnlA family RNA ligase
MSHFYLPTYEECQEIVKVNECFFEKIVEVDGFKVSIFNYRLAEYKDFVSPIENKPTKAFELRGLTFIHTEDGALRYLMLHKFFNLNQVENYQFHEVKDFPIVRIQDKADGSMIRFIRFPNGKIIAKTKGEFSNTQAEMAQDIYNNNPNLQNFVKESLDQGLVAIFELVSPFNQIVLSYEKSNLILLQLREESTGIYLNIYDNELVQKHRVKTVAKEETIESLEKYVEAALTLENIEGWVVTLSNGQMMKVKTKWYCDRHGLLTSDLVRECKIVELILTEKMDDALAMINENDPRRNYAHQIREVLLHYFKEKEAEVESLVKNYTGDRKAWALKNEGKPFFGIAARLLGKSDYQELIYLALKKLVLANTYRLMEARDFLRANGLKTQNIEIDDDDA